MNITEARLEYQLCSTENSGLPVIIVAAGSFTRMQGVNKQLLEIGGVSVIARTMLAFEQSKAIKNIILVVRPDDLFDMQLLAEKYNISKLTDIVCGGATRQESVLRGFERIGEDKTVLIHDGARPFVSEKIICDVAEALKEYPAVTCAVRVKDTIKQVDSDGKVVKTLDRDSLVAVQTPQGVWVKEYLDAAQKAGDVSDFTDDTSLMEWAGYEVYTTQGSYKNIKITTPEDVSAAESFSCETED